MLQLDQYLPNQVLNIIFCTSISGCGTSTPGISAPGLSSSGYSAPFSSKSVPFSLVTFYILY